MCVLDVEGMSGHIQRHSQEEANRIAAEQEQAAEKQERRKRRRRGVVLLTQMGQHDLRRPRPAGLRREPGRGLVAQMTLLAEDAPVFFLKLHYNEKDELISHALEFAE